MSFDNEKSVADELYLTAINEGKIYNIYLCLLKNFNKKIKKNIFNKDLALAAIDRYYLVPAAKIYNKEFGEPGTKYYDYFTKKIRLIAAQDVLDQMFTNIKYKEYDFLK
jgi:hypothetical protein